MKRRIPPLDSLDGDALPLAHMVARNSYLPNPAVVRALPRAVFPTIRNPRKRLTPIEAAGKVVAMYDDNTTPIWALLWAHGITGGRTTGWTFAHVWPFCDDVNCYTNLANLIMVKECLASLTDKSAPVTHFLKWHAHSVYGWKPAVAKAPTKPTGFETVCWRYLEPIADPQTFIRQRLESLNNKRLQILRPLMGAA